MERAMIELTSIHEALVGEIRDLYGAEKQLLGTLSRLSPQLVTCAAQALASALLTDTGNQLWRLEEIFTLLDEDLSQRHSLGMARILDLRKDPRDRAVTPVDARFAAIAERAVHFLAAVHSTAAARARALGYDEVAALLDESVDEARAAGARLTVLTPAPVITTGSALRG